MSSDQIDRCRLFSVWLETEGCLKLKSVRITQEIISFYSIETTLINVCSRINKISYEISKKFAKLWRKYNRNMDRVVNEADYLNKPFTLPQSILVQLPLTSATGRGRKQLPFSECDIDEEETASTF